MEPQNIAFLFFPWLFIIYSQGPTSTPSHFSRRAEAMPPKKTELKDGTCIKATRVECVRKQDYSVHAKADEIHIVVAKKGNYDGMAQSLENDTRKNIRDHRVYEERKIMMASPFNITLPPVQLEFDNENDCGTSVIHVKHEALPAACFRPLTAGDDGAYREISLAEVIFGIDPSIGKHWVTPIALKHIQAMRDMVIEAGGLFLADFDTSVGGWAMFRTLYICPAPSKKLYEHSFKVKALWWDVFEQHNAERPLCLAGGKLYKRGFEPTTAELADPSLFREIDDVLGIS